MRTIENISINIPGTIPTILLMVFIVLKLCGVINWSWWWVLCPFWIPVAIAAVIGLIILIFNIK